MAQADSLDRASVSKTIRAFLDEIRPADPRILAKIDYGFVFHKQSIELFSIRPLFNNPEKKVQGSFAKATFIKSRQVWKVYWRRGNGTWFPYEPATVGSLNAFLKLVKTDKNHCFFG